MFLFVILNLYPNGDYVVFNKWLFKSETFFGFARFICSFSYIFYTFNDKPFFC